MLAAMTVARGAWTHAHQPGGNEPPHQPDHGAGVAMQDGGGAAHPAGTGIRLPLKAKLSLLIISLVVLTVDMTKRGLTIAENFAASAKTPLVTGDELTLAVLVKDAMKDPDVVYAFVV